MSSTIDLLYQKGLIPSLPAHIQNSVSYEVITGSIAYGISTNMSDVDIYAVSIPYKDMIFPHLKGEIPGFGRQIQRFDQFQMHHIKDNESDKEYDINIYNIIKYFQLCMDNNPNMIDTLFVPQNCILHTDTIGRHIRSNRKLFLHKGCFQRFKGYAYKQLHLIRTKHHCAKFIHDFEEKHALSYETSISDAQMLLQQHPNNQEFIKYFEMLNKLYSDGYKRALMVREHGMDFKFATHVVRLVNEVEQILTEHDLDLQRNKEQLKSVRRGDWTFEQLADYFEMKEKILEQLYADSTLTYSPKEDKIKNVLLQCLEIKFGNLNNIISKPQSVDKLIYEIDGILGKYRRV